MADQNAKDKSSNASKGPAGPQTMALNTNKAGMEGLDAEKINEIIQKASEGSKFYQHKQRCQQRLDAKISEMKRAAEAFSEDQIKNADCQMEQIVQELESSRNLSRTIVHVDMDMFYAAVEMRDDPSLRDKPMAVGGVGMLSTSNYAARKFGVRAAMPGFIGKKLCPELVIVKPDFRKYKEASKEIQEIFAYYDPNFCPMSLDEAYLDITQYLEEKVVDGNTQEFEGSGYSSLAEFVVAEMRDKIHKKTDLTASAGIASNTRLAKVCSDMNKPNGQYLLPPDREQILNFMSKLPIRKVSGIGNVMEQQLRALGVNVCSDLLEKCGLLKLLFSDINYYSFLQIGLGLGHTTLSSWTERERKSISTETTFRGTTDRNMLFDITKELCQELAEDMEQKEIYGKVFTLKYKTDEFKIRSRAHTFPDAIQSAEVMTATARRLLQHEMDVAPQPLCLRLIGVRMSNLMSASEVGSNRQMTLTQLLSKCSNNVPKKLVPETVKERAEEHKNQLVTVAGTQSPEKQIKQESKKVTPDSVEGTSKKGPGTSRTKCASIDQFLSKSVKAKSVCYDCPVCGMAITVANLNEFNDHVDVCLVGGVSESPAKCELLEKDMDKDHDNPRNPQEGRLVEIKTLNHIQSNNRNGIYTFCNYDSDDSFSDLEEHASNSLDLPSAETSRKESKKNEEQELMCPVCEKKMLTTFEALDIHIEACLNKNAINEILQQEKGNVVESSGNHSKRKRKGNNLEGQTKKQRNTIEKFFHS